MELFVVFRVLLVGSITFTGLSSVYSQRDDRFRSPSASRRRNGIAGNNRKYQIVFDSFEYEPLLPVPTFSTNANKKVPAQNIPARSDIAPPSSTKPPVRPIVRGEKPQSPPKPVTKPPANVKQQNVIVSPTRTKNVTTIRISTPPPSTKRTSSGIMANTTNISINAQNETQADESIFEGGYYVGFKKMKGILM